jgi:hypothetical protein
VIFLALCNIICDIFNSDLNLLILLIFCMFYFSNIYSKCDVSSDNSACDSNNSCKDDQHKSDLSAISQSTENVSQDTANSGKPTDASNTDRGSDASALISSEGDSMELVKDDKDIASTSAAVQQLHLDISIEESRAKDCLLSTDDSSTGNNGDSSPTSSQHDQTVTAQRTNILSSSNGASNENLILSNSRQLHSDSDFDSSQSSGSDANPRNIHLHADNTTAFNNFQYWRMPLPAIDVDADVVDGETDNVHIETRVKRFDASDASILELGIKVDSESSDSSCTTSKPTEAMEVDQPAGSDIVTEKMETSDCNANVREEKNDNNSAQIHTASVRTVCETVEEVANFGSTHVLGQHVQHVNEGAIALKEGAVQGEYTHIVDLQCNTDTCWPIYVKSGKIECSY